MVSNEVEKGVSLKVIKTIGLPCIPLSLALMVAPSALGLSLRHDAGAPLSSYEAQVNTAPYSAGGRFNNNQSGTLITPHWVLGSAHVGGTLSKFFASDGTTVDVVQRIIFPGDGDASNAEDGNDFALFQLATPIFSIAPATLHDPTGTGVSYTDLLSQIAGLTAVYGGAGNTGDGLIGATGARDILAGTNVIDAVGVDFGDGLIDNIVQSDFDDFDTIGLDNDPGTSLEVGLADKDSGGGLWVDLGDGPVLIGVHSSVEFQNGNIIGQYDQLNYSTVLTPDVYNWIQATVPEPSSLALLAAGGLMVMRRRR